MNIIPSLAWALLDFVWQGLLIGWVTALLFALLRTSRPQLRYAIGCAALLLCAALPIAGTVQRMLTPETANVSMLTLRIGATAAEAAPAALGTRLAGWESVLQSQLPLVILFWSAGAAVLALRMALGLAWIRRRSRPGQYLEDPAWQACVDRLAVRFGVARKVTLGLVGDLTGPMTAGCWRPLILVPAALATGMAPNLLEALLAHEMAHIKRHDYLVNLLQSAIEILLFYHPTVWWLSNRIRIEREQIADDLAASTLGEPRRLALALSELEQFQFLTPQLAPAAHGGNLMNRIKRLVRPDTATLNWKMLLPILGLAGACAGLYAHAAPAEPKKPANWSVTRGSGDTPYALVRGSERKGSILNGSSDDWKDIEAAKQSVNGDFLWFRKGGKAYVVQDQTVVARATAAYAPLDKLGAEMNVYGKQMDVHGKAMEKLGAEMEQLGRDGKPDDTAARAIEQTMRSKEREMRAIERELRRTSREFERSVERGEGEGEREAITKRMNELTGKMAAMGQQMAEQGAAIGAEHARMAHKHKPMEAVGKRMELAGKPMEALGKQMEALGKQMEAHGKVADQAVRALIDDALGRGLARPVPAKS